MFRLDRSDRKSGILKFPHKRRAYRRGRERRFAGESPAITMTGTSARPSNFPGIEAAGEGTVLPLPYSASPNGFPLQIRSGVKTGPQRDFRSLRSHITTSGRVQLMFLMRHHFTLWAIIPVLQL
jgi:hypothetical protein